MYNICFRQVVKKVISLVVRPTTFKKKIWPLEMYLTALKFREVDMENT